MGVMNANKADANRANQQCKETAIDFIAMGSSFLICQWFRGLIIWDRAGHMAGFRAAGENHPGFETFFLTLLGIIFIVFAGILRVFHHRMKTGFVGFTLDLLSTSASLTAAWCLLDATNWFWLHRFKKSMFIGKVMVACTWSFIFIVSVFIFCILILHVSGNIKTSIRGEFTAVALAVGLSWEHLFDRALEEAGELVEGSTAQKIWMVFLTFVLVLIVFPAWTVYMLPQHDPELKKEYKGKRIAPWQAYCDCPCDDDDYDDEKDDSGAYEEVASSDNDNDGSAGEEEPLTPTAEESGRSGSGRSGYGVRTLHR